VWARWPIRKIKKVRQTKVAGPVITYAFPPPKGGGVVYIWLCALCSEGGFRWGHEGTHSKPKGVRLEGPNLALAYALSFFTASSS